MSPASKPQESAVLSPQQQRLMALHDQGHGNPLRTVFRVWIEGAVDPERLRRAITSVLGRHEILGKHTGIRLQEHEPNLEALHMGGAQTGDEPCYWLVRRAPALHVFIASLPAMRADAATAVILVKEMARAYREGGSLQDAPSLQYQECALMLLTLLEQSEDPAGAQFWSEHPPFSLPPVRIPFQRKPGPGHRFSIRSHNLPVATDSATLAGAAAAHGVTPDIFLAACWHATLWRLSGEPDVAIGYWMDGRRYAELESIPGPFARCVPLRLIAGEAMTFPELLPSVHRAVEEGNEFQEAFAFHADQFCPLSFFFHKLEGPIVDGGLSWSVDHVYSCIDRFHLQLAILEADSTLSATFFFDPDVFDAASIERIASCFQALLNDAMRAPHQKVTALELAPSTMASHLTALLRGECRPLPDCQFAHQSVEKWAALNRHGIAIELAAIQLSWRELNIQANRLARHLKDRGIGPDALAGILMQNSPTMLVAILATLKAGGAYVPMDPSWPSERLRLIVRDAGLMTILVDSTTSPLLTGASEILLNLDTETPSWADCDPHDLPCQVTDANLAYVIYTSGSTGRPKGTMISHRGLMNYLLWSVEAYELQTGCGVPLHSSIAFDMSITSLLAPLVAGRPVVLTPRGDGPEALAGALLEHAEFSLVKLTPAHARMLAQQITPAQAAGMARFMVLGGEALAWNDIAFWRTHAPEMQIVNEYGPTETVVGCCTYRAPATLDDGPVPIGRPIANTQLYVLDTHFRPVPPGVSGELYIGGAGIARGYLGQAALTAERFVPDPFSDTPGARLYRTGDLVVLREDGNLSFLGRIDHQVKIRGYRVELGEIEVLLAANPLVQEAAVVLGPHEKENPLLTAFIVPRCSLAQAAIADDLRKFIEDRLPAYMHPARYALRDALPVTASGKVDRRLLGELADRDPHAGTPYVAPRTPDEEILAGIWSQVLRLDRVGIDDRYFALGGDSIQSLQIVSRAYAKGLSLSVKQIFQHQTIRELAHEIESARAAASPAPGAEPFELAAPADRLRIPDDVEDAYPLSALQAGMVFHRELNPESSVYHDIFAFHVRAPFDACAMRAAVERVVQRHPVLRTSFDLATFTGPLQLVHRTTAIPLVIEDLSQFPGSEQEEALAAWLNAEKERGFDPASAPLARFRVFVRSRETFVFALTFHHAILDGWSDAMMLIEMALTYRSLLRGEDPQVRTLSATYRDFVALERQATESHECIEFWREQLRDASPMLLPRRRPVEELPAKRGVLVRHIDISGDVSDKLQELARSLAVPLKSVLLAAHMRVMSVLSGQADVLTTMTSVGRPETEDGDKVLGLHLNSTPFRLVLRGGTWRDLIEDAFETERRALPFRRFPMAAAQAIFGRQRLAETHFYFTHYHIVRKLDEFPELEILDQFGYEETSFPLVANFSLNPATMRLAPYLSADQTQFSAKQTEAMAAYYAAALTAMATAPLARYDACSLLPAGEYETTLKTWNQTEHEASETLVHQMASAQAIHAPEAPAWIFEAETLTYRELEERANRIAALLRSHGAGPDMPIAISMRRSTELVCGVLGILKAGAACVPIDSAYPPHRVRLILEDSGARLGLTHRPLLPMLQAEAPGLTWLTPPDAATHSPIDPAPDVLPEHLAYVIYTSGSTGKPKGIALPHRVLSNLVAWHNAGLVSGARTLQFASISFDVSFYELFVTWASGGALVAAADHQRQDIAALVDLMVSQRVEKAILPVAILQQIAEHFTATGRAPESLREAIVTGEQLQVTTAIVDLFGYLRNCALHNHYGPSETHVATAFPLDRAPEKWASLPAIGGPIWNTRAYIVDANFLPLPAGVAGELLLGGAGLARGYAGRPDLTAEKFVPDPFSARPGARLYKTGDLARYAADGTIEFLGRIDHQVKIRGYRVELGEIETIMRGHAAVRDVAVVAWEDMPGSRQLTAYIVPREQAGAGLSESLRAFLRERLPEYMVPAWYVSLDSLPLTSNRKLDRHALPKPDMQQQASGPLYVEPRTPAERRLAEIWKDVLPCSRAGADDNFFNCGGDSLRATRMVSQIRRAFDVELPLRTFFERPTIAGIASAVEEILTREIAEMSEQEAAQALHEQAQF